jgi:2-polyprenyl-6-methoxyphenol hydroxylase-like FAD-dependent oxidoreductase
MPSVLIGGAGPTGLMLACELRLAGVDVMIVDALPARSGQSRAGGLHPRTMEVLDQRGLLDDFLAVGRTGQAAHFSGLRLDLSAFPTRHPHSLLIPQSTVERLLERRAAELGVQIHWQTAIVGVEADEFGVVVDLQGPDGIEPARAEYLVGCDGGRSAVRKLSGIAFPGTAATMTSLLGDVQLSDPPDDWIIFERAALGQFSVFVLDPGCYRVTISEYDRVLDRNEDIGFEDLRQAMIRVAGTDFGMHSPSWVSQFGDAARQAAEYRRGRVLLAGDAAHIHYPAGGQGQNLGLQDAVNLGWKLALVAQGQAPEQLLDTYHAERHPVAERVLENTRAQTVLSRPDQQTTALRQVMQALIQFPDVNQYLGGMISALDLHYPTADQSPVIMHGSPLLGRRMPDLDLIVPGGEIRMFALLRAGRAVLLDLGANPDLTDAAVGWADRVDRVAAHCAETRVDLPMVGEAPLPTAVLVRPDGYVAWLAVGDPQESAALRHALTTWFGPEHSVRLTTGTNFTI